MRKLCTIIGLALSAAALALPTTASAAGTSCAFTISGLAIDSYGDVNGFFVNGGNTYMWYVCNLSGTITVNAGGGATNFTSGECNALFSQMLTARASGQPVTFWFYTASACTPAALPAPYAWMSPNFPDNIIF